MTTPRHCFCTHDCDPLFVRERKQLIEAFRELRRLHVIRITPKGSVAPTCIWRIRFRMAQASESGQVLISYSGPTQGCRERSLIKLRVMARLRYGSHIRHQCHSVRLKQLDEFLDRVGGMANRKNRSLFPRSLRCLRRNNGRGLRPLRRRHHRCNGTRVRVTLPHDDNVRARRESQSDRDSLRPFSR